MIDSHVHVWDLELSPRAWPDSSVPELNKTMRLEELLNEQSSLDVTGVILVQSADDADDTRNMQRTADRSTAVLGIVGWVEMDADPDAFEVNLLSLTRDPRIVAIRNLMHVKQRPDWIRQPRPDSSLRVLERYELPFDAVVSSHHGLPLVVAMAEDHSDLTVVLDHLGKPPIGGSQTDWNCWRKAIRSLAQNPRVVAKISGLTSQSRPQHEVVEDFRPAVEFALEAFGADRLMRGSDWPLVRLAGGLADTHSAVGKILEVCSDEELQAVNTQTATRTYRLHQRSSGYPGT